MIWKKIVNVSIVLNLFSCFVLASEYTFNKDVGLFYKLYTTEKSWREASQICRNDGGLIAMPSNQKEMNAITTLAKEYFKSSSMHGPFTTYILLGFHDVFESREFVTETGKALQFVFNKFKFDEPNNINEICGSVHLASGKLNDLYCDEPRIFVCQKEKTAHSISSHENINGESFIRECPYKSTNTYTWMTGQPLHWGYTNCGAVQQNFFKPNHLTSVFKLHLTPKAWPTARTICETEGGHLAIIDDAVEQELLVDIFSDPENQVTYSKNESSWLGFHDLFTTGDFVTVIGTSLSFNKEDLTRGSTHCGTMNKEGVLQTMNCSLPLRFFCEKKVLINEHCIKG